MHVLVIDDDEGIRETLRMVLEIEGYEVLEAPNGAAALAVLERVQPAVILLDMRMPGMDGWEFARHYRARPGPHAPIVVVTAAANAQQWATEVQADAWLPKPFDLDQLLTAVAQLARPAA